MHMHVCTSYAGDSKSLERSALINVKKVVDTNFLPGHVINPRYPHDDVKEHVR